MTKRPRLGFAALLAVAMAASFGASASAQAPAAYHLVKTVPLGLPDRWDYVVYDGPSDRVYVSHADRVAVIGGQSGQLIGTVVGAVGGSHGIAISASTGEGFTDDGKSAVALAFNLKTFEVTHRIPTQDDADGIIFDKASGHVFVLDGDSGKVTVIDPVTDKAIATIDGGGGLEFAASDEQGHLYVNGAEKREILSIDTHTNAVDGRWPVPDCAKPHGAAMDVETHRFFTSCVNAKLMVLNTQTGALVATLPIGRGSDTVAFDPVRKLIFSSDGIDGVVSIIKETGPDSYVVLPPLKTTVSGRTMALDPKSGRLFVAASEVEAITAPGARPRPKPGTLRLLMFDPEP